MRELVLDMDSSVSQTHGEQDGTAHNGEQAGVHENREGRSHDFA